MAFVKFLKYLRLKMRRGRASERVAAIDINGEEDVGEEVDFCGLQKSKGARALIFSWEEIEKVSMKFSVVIGYGGFSTVYLAKLCDSSMAAVKIQFRCTQRLDEAYKQELEILLKIKHPNIVNLLGYCGEDREEGALILENAANGNLHEKLHNSSTSSLSWRRRMAIAFQLATAIDHLHQNCIIHCDIKSSNILLDDQLNCKLCDFGSSKMGFSSLVTSSSKSRAAMLGSPGYTDPHYMRTGLVSKKSDVYSFGVILLELVSGMEALNPLSGERLTTRAGPVIREMEKVVEIVDPRLRGRGDFDLEEAKGVVAVAAMCLSNSPAHRPTTSEILGSMRKKVSSISYLF